MHKYLADTEYAAKGIIALYMNEIHAYEKARRDFTMGVEGIAAWDVRGASSPPLLEHLSAMQAKIEQVRESSGKMFTLEASLTPRQFAFEVLCGALLQIAKQGISVAFAGGWKTKCPQGRAVGVEHLRNIIWQARNQAMHYEENKLRKEVRDCFAKLEESFGPQFSLSSKPSTNLAAHIVDLLEWHTYEAYERDMASLLGT